MSITVTRQGISHTFNVNFDDDVIVFLHQLFSVFELDPEEIRVIGYNLRLDGTLKENGFVSGGSYHITNHGINQSLLLPMVADLRMQMGATSQSETNFCMRLISYLQQTAQYEIPEFQEKALKVIPVEELKKRASTNPAKLPDSRDEFMVQLLRWFKREFFKWFDKAQCQRCGGPTVGCGNGTPTREDLDYGGSRVELYKCTTCPNEITRFPRYNHVLKLLETRKGRCGEWANCFTFLCRALGYEARCAFDWTDHVWTEVYSESSKRWVHTDCSEAKWDAPLLYESGWNKKLSYVISFSAFEAVDVTKRYTNNYEIVLNNRKEISESRLEEFTNRINFMLKSLMTSQVTVKRIEERWMKEIEDLKTSNNKNLSSDEKEGRISGSEEWRVSRGEVGGNQKPFEKIRIENSKSVFNFTTLESSKTSLNLVKDAQVQGPSLVITQARNDQISAAWYKDKVDISQNFLCSFSFQVTGPGADGFAFVIQDYSPTALGTGGGGLGYENLLKTLAIEFDSYENMDICDDPNSNHISIHTSQNPSKPTSSHHSQSIGCSGYDLGKISDGHIHYVQIEYQDEMIKVYMDDTSKPAVTAKVNLTKCIGSNSAWIGFTGATGGLNQRQEIKSWSFESLAGGNKLNLHHIPQTTMALADKANYDLLLSKLLSFNNELASKNLGLSNDEINTIKSLMEALKTQSLINKNMIQALEKIIDTFPEDKIFPALDLLRLSIVNNEGNKVITQYGKFSKANSVIEKVLSLLATNGPNQLFCIRFFTNALTIKLSADIIFEKYDNILSALVSCESSTTKGVNVALSNCLLNFSIVMSSENENSGVGKIIDCLRKLLVKDSKDTNLAYPTLLTIGNLIFFQKENATKIIKSYDGFMHLITKMNGDSKIEGTAKEIISLLEIM